MSGSGDEHQKPLSLKFGSKPFWPDLRQLLKVDQTGAALILDICSTPDWVSYSRTARHYDVPRRYRNRLYTYQKVKAQVDYLHHHGLIEHDKCPPGWRGWQSAEARKCGLNTNLSSRGGFAPRSLAPLYGPGTSD